MWVEREIGPRRVGGTYRCDYWGLKYEVLNIDKEPRGWEPWLITVKWEDGRKTSHCTAWRDGDSVISQPTV